MVSLEQITEFSQNGSMDINMFPEYVQILIDQNCKINKLVQSAAITDVIGHFESQTTD